MVRAKGVILHLRFCCPLAALSPLEVDDKCTYVRDSTGQKSRRARSRKRKAEDAPEACSTCLVAQPGPVTCEPVGGHFCLRSSSSAVTPSAAAWHSSRAKRARLHDQLEATRCDAQVRQWLDSRRPTQRTAVVSAAVAGVFLHATLLSTAQVRPYRSYQEDRVPANASSLKYLEQY